MMMSLLQEPRRLTAMACRAVIAGGQRFKLAYLQSRPSQPHISGHPDAPAVRNVVGWVLACDVA